MKRITPASPAAAPPKAALATATFVTPDEAYAISAATAQAKCAAGLPKLLVLGILAGAYIGFGFSLCLLVGGLMTKEQRAEYPWLFAFLFSIFGFPMGLTAVVISGTDLFTSDCYVAVIGLAEGAISVLRALRMLAVSWWTNLLGCLLLVGLMSAGDVFAGNKADFVIELALKKTSYPFVVAFVKAILCNWLVCLAVWQGNLARDLTGKFIGIFLPLTAFVAMGFEHIVANMFLLSMSMALGSGISIGTFIGKMMVPVTLGNIVGGGFFVGALHTLTFGTPAAAVQSAWERGVADRVSRLCRCQPASASVSVSAMEEGSSTKGHRMASDDSARMGKRWNGASPVPSLPGSSANLLQMAVAE